MASIHSRRQDVKSAEPNTRKPLVWPNYGAVSVETSPRNDLALISLKADQEKKKQSAMWSAVLAVTLASLTACSTPSTVISVKPEVPVSLSQPCPDLPDIPDRSEKSVAQWIVETITLYYECAAKHLRLVEAVK